MNGSADGPKRETRSSLINPAPGRTHIAAHDRRSPATSQGRPSLRAPSPRRPRQVSSRRHDGRRGWQRPPLTGRCRRHHGDSSPLRGTGSRIPELNAMECQVFCGATEHWSGDKRRHTGQRRQSADVSPAGNPGVLSSSRFGAGSAAHRSSPHPARAAGALGLITRAGPSPGGSAGRWSPICQVDGMPITNQACSAPATNQPPHPSRVARDRAYPPISPAPAQHTGAINRQFQPRQRRTGPPIRFNRAVHGCRQPRQGAHVRPIDEELRSAATLIARCARRLSTESADGANTDRQHGLVAWMNRSAPTTKNPATASDQGRL